MDWTFAGCNFLRCVVAIFLFTGAGDLRRHSSYLGDVLLQFRAAQCLRWALVHAGYSFAQLGTDRFIFFPALDRQRKIDVAFRSRNSDLAFTADQTSERRHCCAVSVPRLAKMALEFSETTVALAFCRDYNLAFNGLVLARAPNCREILSASFLRRRRNSDRKSFMVLEDRATDWDFEPYAGALDFGDSRFICGARRRI